jgi:hypothetical protein
MDNNVSLGGSKGQEAYGADAAEELKATMKKFGIVGDSVIKMARLMKDLENDPELELKQVARLGVNHLLGTQQLTSQDMDTYVYFLWRGARWAVPHDSQWLPGIERANDAVRVSRKEWKAADCCKDGSDD